MKNEKISIGIDLGGTQIKGVLITESGEILHSLTVNTTAEHSDKNVSTGWRNEIAGMITKLNQVNSQVEAIGIAAPGLSSPDNKSIAYMPGRLQGLENLQWATLLQHEEVWVINDAHAALVAESGFGAGRGVSNQLLLTLGTGVGGAIMIDGKLYQGFIQRAGHMGHMSLNTNAANGILDIPGTLEEAFGNTSVHKRTCGRYKSTSELVSAYVSGNILANFFWLDSVHKLSIALASLINIISPELIILGGGITQARNSLLDPLKEFLDLYEWKPGGAQTRIEFAHFKEYSGAIGSALFALTCKKEKIVT
jgi:glucokinase